jgi:phosphoserine phosphatase
VSAPRFASVVVDVDSTLCGIEGVDWLAQLRGEEIARQSVMLTERAMNGEIPIDKVYGERLALIRPTRTEVERLAKAYRETMAPTAPAAVAALQTAGVRVVLISGGFRQAIAPLAGDLRVELHAVDLHWDDAGEYVGFDTTSPLATQSGKLQLVRTLALPRPTLAMGDGSTDATMRAAVDEFAAFTGFARRDAVVAVADREIATYEQLRDLVLSRAR